MLLEASDFEHLAQEVSKDTSVYHFCPFMLSVSATAFELLHWLRFDIPMLTEEMVPMTPPELWGVWQGGVLVMRPPMKLRAAAHDSSFFLGGPPPPGAAHVTPPEAWWPEFPPYTHTPESV